MAARDSKCPPSLVDYLGKYLGFTISCGHAFGWLFNAILHLSTTGRRDPRDNDYAALSIVRHIFPSNIRNAVIPNYSLSIVQVYTDVVTIIIQHCKSIYTLSDVEGHFLNQ